MHYTFDDTADKQTANALNLRVADYQRQRAAAAVLIIVGIALLLALVISITLSIRRQP